ncbi:hypothetical protein AB0J63_03680 [Streptosporangium canum]|uniref:hypothetical protein n=1 Tax=Streptosporangium TaxID=2000 RepID=UPI00068B7750|nr:hypothetical protein [Streptosporangium roseum]
MSKNHRRRLLIKTDIVSYGTRDDRDQRAAQRNFLHLLDEAAENAGLNRKKWFTQSSGDGEFAILPGREPEPRVVDDFVRQLDSALDHHNAGVLPSTRIRLRVAIHVGVISPADNGIAGAAAVAVGRMVDCGPLREAIAAAEPADLALIVSDEIYRGTIAGRLTTWRDDDFREVTVQVKELTTRAWIHVPRGGLSPHGSPERGGSQGHDGPPGQAAARPHEEAQASPSVVNTFYGTVHTQGGTIGISNG